MKRDPPGGGPLFKHQTFIVAINSSSSLLLPGLIQCAKSFSAGQEVNTHLLQQPFYAGVFNFFQDEQALVA